MLEDLDIVALGAHSLSQILPVSLLMLGRLDFEKLGVLPSHGVHRPLVKKWVVLAVGDLVEIVTARHYLDIIICWLDKFSLYILSFDICSK